MDGEHTKGFWTSLPGILAGVAAIVTAATGLVVVLRGGSPPASPAARPVAATAAPAGSIVAAAATAPAPAGTIHPFVLRAVIQDPDGFTNLRQGGTASAPVLARVNAGEVFHTYEQNGDWWEVRTAEGTIGFMHASRIRVLLRPDTNVRP